MVVCSHVYPSPLKELIQNFKTSFLGSACVRAKIANEHERTLAAFLLYLGRFLPLLLFTKDFPMLVPCGSRKQSKLKAIYVSELLQVVWLSKCQAPPTDTGYW